MDEIDWRSSGSGNSLATSRTAASFASTPRSSAIIVPAKKEEQNELSWSKNAKVSELSERILRWFSESSENLTWFWGKLNTDRVGESEIAVFDEVRLWERKISREREREKARLNEVTRRWTKREYEIGGDDGVGVTKRFMDQKWSGTTLLFWSILFFLMVCI